MQEEKKEEEVEMVLVPRHPTKEMIEVGALCLEGLCDVGPRAAKSISAEVLLEVIGKIHAHPAKE